VLDRYAIRDAVIAEEREEGLLLRGRHDRRLTWEDTFKEMAREREDWSDLETTLGDGLDAGRRAEIAVDQIRTVSKERLGRRPTARAARR
jgi:hypothetical protein